MNKTLRVGLKILIVVLLIVCMLSALYLYAGKTINNYYKTAENEVFASSMDVKKVFLMEDGRTMVVGTFLQQDDILANSSIFFKSYEDNGSLIKESSVEIPEGFELYQIEEGKNSVAISVVKNDGNEHIAQFIMVDSKGNLICEHSSNDSGSKYKTVEYFISVDNDSLYEAVLYDNQKLVLKQGDNLVFETEISLDIKIKSVSHVFNTTYLCGTKESGEGEIGYIEARESNGNKAFEITTMDDYVSVCNKVFSAYNQTGDDYVYVLGTYYSEDKGDKTMAITSVNSQNERYGSVLVSSQYSSNPWSSYFIAKLSKDGKVSAVESPFETSMDFGISEIVDVKAESTICSAISRVANALNDDHYYLNIYDVGKNIKAGKSVRIEIPSYEKIYVNVTGDGKIVCYSGISYNDGCIEFSLKTFENIEEFAKTRRKMSILQSSIEIIDKMINVKVLYIAIVFLIFYFTVRIDGTYYKEKKFSKLLKQDK